MKSHWKEPWAYPDKTCNRCGATGLHWVETDQGWRLYDGDEIHRCNRSEVKVNMKPLTQTGFLAMRDRAEKAEAELAEAREEVEVLRELLENKRRSQHYEDITKI